MKKTTKRLTGVGGWAAKAGGVLLVGAAINTGVVWRHIAEAQSPGALPAAHARADSAATSATAEPESGIDALIQHLHDTFKITATQEPLWAQVAAVMRENAANLTRLAKVRSETAGKRTAVDDLESYAEISAAHADGTKKLVPVFKALYASLSESQKKTADSEFRDHYRGHTRHGS